MLRNSEFGGNVAVVVVVVVVVVVAEPFPLKYDTVAMHGFF